VIERAQAAEAGGFDEFWLIEDCFYTAGISLAATVLAATSDITVGLGVMAVVARNAAVTAMEIATSAVCGSTGTQVVGHCGAVGRRLCPGGLRERGLSAMGAIHRGPSRTATTPPPNCCHFCV